MMDRGSLKDLGIDGSIIINWFYWNRMGGWGFESCRWRWGQAAGCCERCL